MKAKIAKPIKSIDLDQLEDGGLYFVLFLIFVFQIISSIDTNHELIPKIDFGTWGILLIFFFFLTLFRVLIKKIDDLRGAFVHDIDLNASLNHQVGELIKKKPALATLDILATDTTNFYHALVDLHFHANQIRILLSSKTAGIDDIIAQWTDLKNDGKICNELIIRTYDLSPTLYGMIMDRSDGCFGFFYPKYVANPAPSNNKRSTGPYVLDHHSPMEMKILQDMCVWFDQAFESHSRLVYSSLVLDIKTLE
jgi:hypothetical protein